MKMFRQSTVSALIFSLMASACAGSPADNPNPAAAAEDAANDGEELELHSVPGVAGHVSMETKPGAAISPGPEMIGLVDLAKKDLAANLSINEQAIEIVQANFVTWPDSSLGCPQAGMQYLQVLTSGALIVFKSRNVRYQYHSGGNRPPFLCKNPSPDEPLPYEEGEA